MGRRSSSASQVPAADELEAAHRGSSRYRGEEDRNAATHGEPGVPSSVPAYRSAAADLGPSALSTAAVSYPTEPVKLGETVVVGDY